MRERYAQLGPSKPLDQVFALVEGNGASHAIREGDYIDADYRDEFANFYASTYPPFPDRCERLHFLNSTEHRYLGYAVIRPVPERPVCRTMLAPPADLKDFVSCVTASKARPYGRELRATGFPFIGQDRQYGVCAHASIWMSALYHHLAHRRDRYHLSDLVRAAGGHQEADRLIPSSGLTTAQMASVFRAIRLPALYYDMRRLPKNEDRASIVCRYLNSRLPVVLATASENAVAGHATALIGYRRDDEGFTFIRHDDAVGPYQSNPRVSLDDRAKPGNWKGLLIPLPGRIYLPGESAEERGRIFLRTLLGEREDLQPLLAAWDKDDLRLRSYVTEAGDFKAALHGRGLAEDLVGDLRRTGMSHWVWVVELHERAREESRDSVVAEVIIDATSDREKPRILAAYLPGVFMRWVPFDATSTDFEIEMKDSARHTTGCALTG